MVPDIARLQVRMGSADGRDLARRIDLLAEAGKVDPFEAALFYLTIGRKDRAAVMLRAEDRSVFLADVQRNDPRLLALR